MNDFASQIKTAVRITLFSLSFCLVGWAFMTAARPEIAGFCIGIAVSLINGVHLAWKVNRIGQVAVDPARRRTGLGFLSRGAMAVLGVIVSERLDFSIIATIAGLFIFQLVAYILGFISSRKKP
jgi:ATP synthase protein I